MNFVMIQLTDQQVAVLRTVKPLYQDSSAQGLIPQFVIRLPEETCKPALIQSSKQEKHAMMATLQQETDVMPLVKLNSMPLALL